MVEQGSHSETERALVACDGLANLKQLKIQSSSIGNYGEKYSLGDEMNGFLAQSDHTRAEASQLVSVGKNFTSSQDSKPMLAIKQDAMTGAYKLTYGRVPIRKSVFMDCFCHEKFSMERYMDKRAHVLKVYQQLGWFDDVMDEETRWEREEELLYSGHSLFSFLLPNDFEYYLENNISPLQGPNGKPQPVFITQGVMVSGTLNKAAMGSASASLIHHLWKDYGEVEACWFVSMYQICINFWLQHEGFSVGLEDCIPSNQELIQGEMQKCFLKAHTYMNSENNLEMREMKIMEALNSAMNVGQKHAKEALKPRNNLVSMIRSGAKGDWVNITQVTGLVGQQNVSAQRIPKNYGNRTLAYYKKQGRLINDPDNLDESASVTKIINMFQSRGFVTSSFYYGLTPTEFFFHAAGGREGLIDTGCKTAQTGYGQRRLIKMMEDCRASYTGVVTNSINNVIQFDYGGDNMDASHLINVSKDSSQKVFSFMHADHVSQMLNTQFEQCHI